MLTEGKPEKPGEEKSAKWHRARAKRLREHGLYSRRTRSKPVMPVNVPSIYLDADLLTSFTQRRASNWTTDENSSGVPAMTSFPISLYRVRVSARLSCKRAGKTRTLMPVWDSSGESRIMYP